ncbi:hypothetical protein L915_04308 [Phytophthora nicotianae]|uniref:Uncharacterized protein n=1 Tax=Phytophthora nicotianae TaxID=4792 RepID=W2JGV6_PHYNI|nr:hypothetical protein L915_04308 [Phytophthora nicotianae]ETL45680.1 hypothetical protein L916_04269 [Phytophthora nicotianae]
MQPEERRPPAGEFAAKLRPPLVAGKRLNANMKQVRRWARYVLLGIPWTPWTNQPSDIQPLGLPKADRPILWMIPNGNGTTIQAITRLKAAPQHVLTLRKDSRGASNG